MVSPLLIALPSKGRIHDEVLKWLEALALPLKRSGTARGYSASLDGLAGAEVRLLSASEVAASLADGSVHLGITGLDLLHERAGGLAPALRVLLPLGFSKARVVVAVPAGWLDVDTMEDLRDAAARYHEKTRKRFRVATKFRQLTRSFFAAHGLLDYRIVDSLGATEGAPGAGAAELIVDITETGATLAANQLRILDDGLILQSEAVLAGSGAAAWSKEAEGAARAFGAAIAAKMGAGPAGQLAEALASLAR